MLLFAPCMLTQAESEPAPVTALPAITTRATSAPTETATAADEAVTSIELPRIWTLRCNSRDQFRCMKVRLVLWAEAGQKRGSSKSKSQRGGQS